MDNSFLRLVKNDFSEARINENFLAAKIVDNRFVQMLPNETFLQISNCKEDIAFGGNVTIELVNCASEVLKVLQINEDIFINEFTNIVTGIKNIAFEFGYLGTDFGNELLYLRFSQPSISDNIWYSAPFIHTYISAQETTRFDYKNQSYFNGISYDVQNYFQSIRLTAYDNDRDWIVKNEGYTEISGDAVSYRQINTKITKGIFKYCNIFTIDRLVSLFSHNLIYINNLKVNNKPNFKKGEMLGTSNFFQLNYDYNQSEQKLPTTNQLFKRLDLVNVVPSGIYSLGNYNSATSNSTLFSLSFNKSISITNDIILKVYKNGVLFATFDNTKFTVVGQILNIDVSASPITDTADYTFKIEPNKVYRNAELWQGGKFEFSIVGGEYSNTEYTNEYLIN